jgi:pimeloyl-ACP methyl ester carboxylesterase
VTDRFFAEINGTRLYVEVEGAIAPVVFVHGFSLDTRTWDAQVADFADRYRVVRYDLRGFGRSAIPEPEVRYEHRADLRALIDALGLERPVLVGLSLGGAVVLDFARANPGAARAIVLVDAILPGFDAPGLDTITRPIWSAGRNGGAGAARALWQENPMFAVANARPHCAEPLRQMIADYSGWGWTDPDPGRWGEPPVATELDRIDAPALVVTGEHDIADFQRVADALATGIPGACKVVLPGLGHLPNMEDPALFNRTVLDFLASASRR